jgi:AraC-like DNA-binding protein
MNCFFDTCTEAINFAIETKSFGAFFSQEKNQNQNVHIHECCEIFLCLEGGKTFLIDGTVYDIEDGDLFIINPFEAHKVVPFDQGKFSRYILHIHPSFLYSASFGDVNLSDCFYSSGKITKISLTNEEKENFISFFEELKLSRSYGDETYKKLRVAEILLEINRLFSIHNQNAPAKSSHKTIQLAVDYINKNFDSPINLETVAKNAFISPTQLSRLFKQYCGTTVAKYIVSKRITEAKKLLFEGKSVTEAALSSGFFDSSYYTKMFKRYMDCTPREYIKSKKA